MTENEKLTAEMSDYDKQVVAQGLSEMMKKRINPDDIADVLDAMSDRYGGYGLISVMSYFINN